MMKATIEKSNQPTRENKANKRSQALKSILEEQENESAVSSSHQTISLADIAEDLIANPIEPSKHLSTARVITFHAGKLDQNISSGVPITQSIALFHSLIEKELAKAANQLDIDEKELQAWVDLQIEVPAKSILALLRSIQSLHLDPLSEEIGLTQYEDGHWQVFITIEGCSKLLNQHPQFNGLVFNQADTLIDSIPEWIECSIYRRDRTVPTTVREYLMEVRGANVIWQKMPRRMLRHRALQQCVRLAIA
jgi:RecT family